jgi:hypothetical protein
MLAGKFPAGQKNFKQAETFAESYVCHRAADAFNWAGRVEQDFYLPRHSPRAELGGEMVTRTYPQICHSERSEESLTISEARRPGGKRSEMFRFAQHDSSRKGFGIHRF